MALLLGGGAQHASDREAYAARVKVKAQRTSDGVRHDVRVENKATTAGIVSFVLSGGEGFTEPPLRVIPPAGWHSRVVPWPAEGPKRFAVVLTCDPNVWRDETLALGQGASPLGCTDESGMTRTVEPQDTSEFGIVLPYESAGLVKGRVRIVFGDGRVLEAPQPSGR